LSQAFNSNSLILNTEASARNCQPTRHISWTT
jgi:hypothetical protein